MKSFAWSLLLLAGIFAGTAYAQSWHIFVPQERDFRVLFPGDATRSNDADGSVTFRSTHEEVEYSVSRLPPRTARITDERGELQRRITARVGDDVHVRSVRDDEDGDWQRYVFEVRRTTSVHRLVEYRGQYYELQVRASHEQRGVARHTARDFFNSFHLQGISLATIGGTLVQRVENWCQTRTHAFARAFCEYSVCLQPGYEKYPHCSVLSAR